MPDKSEIEARFWSALRLDMFVMLGLAGGGDGHAQPMTAILHDRVGGRGPIWFFSGKDVDLVRAMGSGAAATIHFAAKGHDLFASIEGRLRPHDDRATIDRLWNDYVAAWYEGGKDDPNLKLLRFEPDHAQIWLNEQSLFRGIRIMFGGDPRQDYAGQVAEIDLD